MSAINRFLSALNKYQSQGWMKIMGGKFEKLVYFKSRLVQMRPVSLNTMTCDFSFYIFTSELLFIIWKYKNKKMKCKIKMGTTHYEGCHSEGTKKMGGN
jgi:hypothetical protein